MMWKDKNKNKPDADDAAAKEAAAPSRGGPTTLCKICLAAGKSRDAATVDAADYEAHLDKAHADRLGPIDPPA